MIERTRLTIAAVTYVSMFALSAHAANYKITTIEDNGTFAGCVAQNEPTGLGIVAVGSSVAVLAESKTFTFGSGDTVSGSWSVDGGKATDFSGKSSHAGIATIDVPNTSEAVTALTTGKQLDVLANGTKAKFDLTGAGEAFGSLVQCMESKKAP